MSKVAITLRIMIVVVTSLLFAHVLLRDYFVESLQVYEQEVVARSSEESFQGIYFRGQHIGYVRNMLAVQDDLTIQLAQEAFLNLNILGETHAVRMKGTARLTKKFLLQSFTFHIEAPFYTSTVVGDVQGSDILLRISTGKDEIHDRIHLESPPFFSTNRRAYLLNDEMQPGQKVKVPYFDPISLTGQNTVVEYKGRAKTLINDRVYNLHLFEEVFSGVRVKSWLNDKGDVVKEESPAGFVFLAEPEFKAKRVGTSSGELLAAVSIPLAQKITGLEELHSLRLRLGVPEPELFSLDGDRQSFDGQMVIITREQIDPKADFCVDKARFLEASSYVQAHHAKMRAVVESLLTEKMTAFEKVRRLAGWVYTTVEKRPVLGIPDALTVLATGKGDCNEHAALFAALARTAGIPTRIAAGVTYHEGAFYYHAWNEICLGDTWISLDTTKNQLPADVGHLKFIEGEVAEQVKIGALLGQLKISLVESEGR